MTFCEKFLKKETKVNINFFFLIVVARLMNENFKGIFRRDKWVFILIKIFPVRLSLTMTISASHLIREKIGRTDGHGFLF